MSRKWQIKTDLLDAVARLPDSETQKDLILTSLWSNSKAFANLCRHKAYPQANIALQADMSRFEGRSK